MTAWGFEMTGWGFGMTITIESPVKRSVALQLEPTTEPTANTTKETAYTAE